MDAENELKVGVRELRGRLSYFLDLAAKGTTVLVTSREAVVAEIKAPQSKKRVDRQFGRLKGRIRMDEDFIDLPDDVLNAMES